MLIHLKILRRPGSSLIVSRQSAGEPRSGTISQCRPSVAGRSCRQRGEKSNPKWVLFDGKSDSLVCDRLVHKDLVDPLLGCPILNLIPLLL